MKNQTKYAEIARKLWFNSAFISRKIDSSIGAIHGIGFSEYMVLLKLANSQNNILRRIDLSESVGRTASGITRMLIPMEKIGLVEKQVCPRDARASLVKITPTGKKILNESMVTFDQKSEDLLKRLNNQQTEDFLNLLNILEE